jgi:hypothetical protein
VKTLIATDDHDYDREWLLTTIAVILRKAGRLIGRT